MPFWISKGLLSRTTNESVIAGVNDDDCAILKFGKEQIVITSDYLNANPIALELGIGSFYDLGRVLVGANISDLCGTGALPKAFMTSVMMKRDVDAESNFKSFMKGVAFELKKHGVVLVGGDTKLGAQNCFCGIAIGMKERGTKLFLKNGAKDGDSIWVSGSLGNVAAAATGLKAGYMDDKWKDWARKKITRPSLPLQLSREIATHRYGNGGTDISDGLGADLYSLCKASNVGAVVEVDLIPLEKGVKTLAKKEGKEPWKYAFTIGGDFQFIVTAKSQYDDVLNSLGCTKIGTITKGQSMTLRTNGVDRKMPLFGHRDSNNSTFVDEIKKFIDDIS